jgi:hypothetical protein
MPTETNVRAIYLGSHGDLDTNESVTGAELADQLLGSTFGSVDNPLAHNIFQSTLYDGNDSGNIAFDGPGGFPATEYVTVDGLTHYLDSGILYSGSVTYMDGTTVTGIPLRVLQDSTGDLALVPPPSGASALEINALTTQPIRSITLDSILQNNFNALNSTRYGLTDAPTFVCFRNGTLILTARGEIAVEDLRAGDMVITRDHGPKPLRWIGSKALDAAVLQAFASLRPVRIRAGALGAGLPTRDLYVSQQHRVLVSSAIAQRMFGSPEILVAAKHLTAIAGIEIDDSCQPLSYFHLLFDQHEIVCSEGAQTESLFTGPEALKSVDPSARAEIIALFPELLASDGASAPARPIGKAHKVRQLAKRHSQNHHELQSALTR